MTNVVVLITCLLTVFADVVARYSNTKIAKRTVGRSHIFSFFPLCICPPNRVLKDEYQREGIPFVILSKSLPTRPRIFSFRTVSRARMIRMCDRYYVSRSNGSRQCACALALRVLSSGCGTLRSECVSSGIGRTSQ